MAGVENVAIAATDAPALIDFARANHVGLTIVGPEAPLAEGLVDAFQRAGLRVFGPTQAAAQLESSKAFAKAFMVRHNLPTASAATFEDFASARDYLRTLPGLPVIKASGLAADKGVVVPNSIEEAEAALHAMLVDEVFGASGATVLIEERLVGPELSVLAFCDGKVARLMPGAQDHKRLLDGDQGPNTGGMGAFAPSPLATKELLDNLAQEVFAPALAGMADEGNPFVGVLYAGLMLTSEGPKLLEFNCRFGDPETQVILPLLESDLLEVVEACVDGQLAEVEIVWKGGAALTVVMASGGYPADYTTGETIRGIAEAEAEGSLVFHAGTRVEGASLVTAGGRVLAVTAVAPSIAEAATHAYAGVEKIAWHGAHYRTDIAGAWR
jgi:phosphoribosylamine--glycine ligase